MKTKKVAWIAILCSGIVVLLALMPYVFVFSNSFSIHNQDWGSFGEYLSGISSLFNVVIFILITLMIHKIDSTNKHKELEFIQKKEIFTRFLSVYEEWINNFYSLKTKLAISFDDYKKLNVEELLEFYVSLKSLSNYSKVYIIDENNVKSTSTTTKCDIPQVLNIFLDEQLFALISLVTGRSDKNTIETKIKETCSKIESVINSVNEVTTSFIEKGFIYE